MFNDLLLGILIAVCTAIALWGLSKRERIYQYPFLVSGFFFVFIIPQAISLINYPGFVTTDIAIQRVLIMSFLCVLASWLGYLIPIPHRWLLKKPLEINEKRLQSAATVYTIIGIIFNLLLFVYLPEGETAKITGQSSGITTIYIFFMRGFLYIGFPIIVINALKKISLKNLFLIAFALSVPLYQAIFLGRRSSLALVILSIALIFYFVRRVLPYRSIAIVSLIFALFATLNIKAYRNVLIEQQWNDLTQIEYTKNVSDFFSEEQGVLELRNGALLMNFTADRGYYGWGTVYWDQLVFRFVPGQFLGKKFKNSLGLYKTTRPIHLRVFYGYQKPIGSTSTGIAEAFTQFDYFGCLLFAFTAIFCKWLWLRSLIWNNPIEQSIYINVIVVAVIGVIGTGHSTLFAALVGMFVFLLPIIIFCEQKPSKTIHHLNHYPS